MPFFQDARGFTQAASRRSDAPATCAHAYAAAGADPSSNTFWATCAGPLYAAQCSRQKPELTPSSANLNGLASLSLLSSRPAVSTGTTSRNNAMPSLRSLPCPTLYQAKEPEAISDVFRRAGKKALGGGIPGGI